METIGDFVELINRMKKAKSIVLTTHILPDADGIGAMLALRDVIFDLAKKNNLSSLPKIEMIIDDDIPLKLSFLRGIEDIKKYENIDVTDVDLIISLDVSTFNRLGRIKNYKNKIEILNIDHHINSELFGDYNFKNTISVSVTEIIYNLIESLGLPMSKSQAESIYVGMLNDTNNFNYSNTTENLLKKVEKLVEKGINREHIFEHFYLRKNPSAIKVYEKAKEKSQKIHDLKFIYSYLTIDEIKKCNGNKFDTEGLSDELLENSDYEFSLFLMDEPNGRIRGSMRTTLKDFDLNNIVSVFNGGGHKMAVGFSIDLTKDQIIEKVTRQLRKYFA